MGFEQYNLQQDQQPSHEKKNKTEALQDFLEASVFKSFRVGKEDEERRLQEIKEEDLPEEIESVYPRSFENIRETLELFFKRLTVTGITKRKEEKALEEKKLNEKLKEWGIEVSEDKGIPWEIAHELHREIHEEISDIDFTYKEESQNLLEKIREEIEQVKNTASLHYNAHIDNIDKILASGKISPQSKLSDEERNKATKTGGAIGSFLGADQSPEGYEKRRTETEEKLGLTHLKDKPIYVALGSENGQDELRGAAPNFGREFLKLKLENLKNRILFTEGDSMNDKHGLPRLLDQKKNKGVESRHLVYEHALIAKAIFNVAMKLEYEIMGVKRKKLQYIEGQVMGDVTINDIESINIPQNKHEDFMRLLGKRSHLYSKYSQYGKPINSPEHPKELF